MYNYLGISLQRLLQIGKLRGARILAGKGGMNKRITKVDVMEVPDIIEWVGEGELLITTVYSIKDNINILMELIPELNEKGVAALGIKIGRYIKELPHNIIDLADRINFPIIEIPIDVSHREVISIVLDAVIEDQMNKLLTIEKFNREVMDIMMKGGNLKEIGEKLYENMENSLVIYENMDGNCETFCTEEISTNVIDKLINEHLSLSYKRIEDESDEIYNESMDTIQGKSIKRVIIPIIIEKVEYGCIFIWLDKKELAPLDKILIESYVHIIALDFVKKLSISKMESRYKLEFFDDLLSDNEDRQNKAMDRAKTFDFHLDKKHGVAVIYLNDNFQIKNTGLGDVNFNSDVTSTLLFITGRVARTSKEKILYVDKNDRIIILYENNLSEDSQAVKEKVKSLCNDILMDISKKFKKKQFKIGIGRCYNDAYKLNKSYQQAKFIVEKLNKSFSGSIIHYDDLGLYRILCFNGLQGELAKFCNDTIKPLVEYDRLNGTELIKTLKIYFECNGNMKKMSKQMFMHYNTIIYRLQKIKDIIGMDVENAEERLDLEIAIKAWNIIR
ncbi:PucR family transcriptional regulator [Clostridium sp. JNZ X4-2]